MPKSTRSRKSKKNTYFGGSTMNTISQTGTNVLNSVGDTADKAGTGIQKFFTDGYNKIFKKSSSSSNYSSGGTRKRRGGYSFPGNMALNGAPVNYKGGRRSRRGGYSFPNNPSMLSKNVNYKGGRRSRRGGYSSPQALSQNAAPTSHYIPYNKHGGKKLKKGGFYKAMNDINYGYPSRPPIIGASFPGTTAQPHHWVGKAQRWVGPSGNAAFLH